MNDDDDDDDDDDDELTNSFSFAQFFIAPLFTPEVADREMKAVDSGTLFHSHSHSHSHSLSLYIYIYLILLFSHSFISFFLSFSHYYAITRTQILISFSILWLH
jgi:hypothetical protein